MEASTCVGRVGGLAVGLGIGVAIASGAGAAWADRGDATDAGAGAGHTANLSHAGAPNSPAATRRGVRSALAAATTSRATAAPITPVAVVDKVAYRPLHTAAEAWINSDVGQRVNGVINTITRTYAIGDGAPGTEAHPDGGAGGRWFGDGGPGWNSTTAGAAGGNGGSAGLLGDGGVGGAGGPAPQAVRAEPAGS